MKPLRNKNIANYLNTLSASYISYGFLFVFFIVLTRALSIELYGMFQFLIALFAFVTMFSLIGTQAAVTHFIATATEDTEKSKIISTTALLTAIISLIVYALIALGAYQLTILLYPDLSPEDTKLIVRWIQLFAVYGWANNMNNWIRGVCEAINSYGARAVNLLVVNGGALLGGLFLVTEYVSYLPLALVVSSVCALFITGVQVSRKYSLTRLFPKEELLSFSKKFYSYGARILLLIGGGKIEKQIDVLILGALLSPTAVAIYANAYNLLEILFRITQSINTVLFPILSSLFQKKQFTKMRHYMKRTTLLSAGLLAVAVPVCYVVAPYAFELIYGPAYAESATIFRYLLLMLIFAVFTHYAIILNAVNKPQINGIIVLIFAAINAILNFVFIPEFGVYGAVIASILSYSLLRITTYIIASRTLKALV